MHPISVSLRSVRSADVCRIQDNGSEESLQQVVGRVAKVVRLSPAHAGPRAVRVVGDPRRKLRLKPNIHIVLLGIIQEDTGTHSC